MKAQIQRWNQVDRTIHEPACLTILYTAGES